MAIIGSSFYDLIDDYKAHDRNGNIAPVIEMLTEMSPILADAIAVECNQGKTHLHTVRTGLPDLTWGKLYKGISNSKSQKAQVEDTTGFVEGLSTIDERVLKLSKNPGAARMSEAKGFLQAMANEVGEKMFYANSATAPEEFMGLAPRFNDLSAANGSQIIDAGGTGADNTSIWFVTWGDEQCQMIYPEGTQAGVSREDKGSQRVLDANGDPYYAKEELFSWHVGLAVKDWRYVARVANIDLSELQAGNVDIYAFMRKAYWKLHGRRNSANGSGGKIAIYMNADVLEALDATGSNNLGGDNYVRLTPMTIQGEEVMSYRGMPIRETDALLNTEARVV